MTHNQAPQTPASASTESRFFNATAPQFRTSEALKQRAEEQVVCAILHAISLYGIYALVASAVVWATRRKQSRFIATQSFQALLFQICLLVATMLIFGLFMLGFFLAASSGSIARTGVDEPGLTVFLISAWGFGMSCFFFAQWILPLWGIWAAIQILRGHNFRYPVLGNYAILWGPEKHSGTQPTSQNQTTAKAAADNERMIAGIGHLSGIIWSSPIVGPVLWAATKQGSRFLSYQLFQAALFQLITTGIIVALFIGMWASSLFVSLFAAVLPDSLFILINLPMWTPGCLGIFFLIIIFSVVSGAIQTFKGKVFHYPIVGRWLRRYLYLDERAQFQDSR